MEDLTSVFCRLEQVFYKDIPTSVQENEHDQKDPQHQQHHNILETLWLAVVESDDTLDSRLLFNERPRFKDLMVQHQSYRRPHDRNTTQYPLLISFVGSAGAGKSSLIEVLLGHLWEAKTTDGDLRDIPVPVTGDNSDSLPTSSDIHLYQDLIAAKENPERPLLFADCEGFGTANHSAAANSRAESMKSIEANAPDQVRQDARELSKWTKKAFDTTMRFIKRTLRWLDPNIDRSGAIQELFPKLVYNISDVVVYVIAETNIKDMGIVFEKLVKWSQKAEMSSINRRYLPSLIILINQCDSARTKDWSSDKTADIILERNAKLMESNDTIKARKEELARFDLPHKNIKDILNNSFTTVNFFRLPIAKDTSRLMSQFQELYAMINSLTEATQEKRKESNMLLSAEQLERLYQLAFNHFSESTTNPFDFMDALFSANPAPTELSGNFFELLQATFAATRRGNHGPTHQHIADTLVAAVVPIICSTVAIHSRMSHFPGLLPNIFPGNTSKLPSRNLDVLDGSYEKVVNDAFQRFADSTLPCGYTFSDSDNKETRICVNGRGAHTQQSQVCHQDADGVRFGSGPFDDSFEIRFSGQWAHALASHLDSLATKNLDELWDVHRSAIRRLHDVVPKVDLGRLHNCVWCMRNLPTERLSCGHRICPSCMVIVSDCDQHPNRV